MATSNTSPRLAALFPLTTANIAAAAIELAELHTAVTGTKPNIIVMGPKAWAIYEELAAREWLVTAHKEQANWLYGMRVVSTASTTIGMFVATASATHYEVAEIVSDHSAF